MYIFLDFMKYVFPFLFHIIWTSSGGSRGQISRGFKGKILFCGGWHIIYLFCSAHPYEWILWGVPHSMLYDIWSVIKFAGGSRG